MSGRSLRRAILPARKNRILGARHGVTLLGIAGARSCSGRSPCKVGGGLDPRAPLLLPPELHFPGLSASYHGHFGSPADPPLPTFCPATLARAFPHPQSPSASLPRPPALILPAGLGLLQTGWPRDLSGGSFHWLLSSLEDVTQGNPACSQIVPGSLGSFSDHLLLSRRSPWPLESHSREAGLEPGHSRALGSILEISRQS